MKGFSKSLFTGMYLYLPGFTLIYQNISTVSTFYCDLPLFTWAYPYFPLLSRIYRDLPLFTGIYHLTYTD